MWEVWITTSGPGGLTSDHLPCSAWMLRSFEEGVRKALAELGSSHTVFYHERSNRLLPQHSINATIRAFGHDGRQRWHFLDVFEGGPAHLAGIKRRRHVDRRRRDAVRTSGDASIPNWRDVQYCRSRVRWVKTCAKSGSVFPSERAPKTVRRLLNRRARFILAAQNRSSVPYFPGPPGLASRTNSTGNSRSQDCRAATASIIDLRGNIGGSLGFARLASYLCPGRIPIGHSLTPAPPPQRYSRDTLPRVPMPRTTR